MLLRSDLAAVLSGLAQERAATIKAQGEQEAERIHGQNESALQKYLKGSVGDDGTYQPGVESAAQSASQQESLNAAKGLSDQLGTDQAGHRYNVSVGSRGTDISEQQAFNPMINKALEGDNAARMAAGKAYMSGAGKLQESTQALSEGLDAVNDPSNKMSRGQALGTLTRGLGLSRFPNKEEAAQLLPQSLQGMASEFENWAGDTKNPMNPADVAAYNSFAKSLLVSNKQQHDVVKKNAVGLYQRSPFATPQGMQEMSQMGAPMDQEFNGLQQKYAPAAQTRQVTDTAGAGQPNQPIQNQPTGIAGFFSKLRGGGASQGPTPQAAPQPQAGAPPVDDQTAFIQKFMAAKKAAQQPTQPQGTNAPGQ